MKKKCLAQAVKLVHGQDLAGIQQMKTFGAWSSSSTHICLAHYLQTTIYVHTEHKTWAFAPGSERPSRGSINLVIRNQHCDPATCVSSSDRDDTSPETCRSSTTNGNKACAPPHLLAGMIRPKRKRTKQVILGNGDRQHRLFVPPRPSRIQNE
eukprot:3452656-Amphidinium_carterae.1